MHDKSRLIKQKTFLAHYAQYGNITLACSATKVSRTMHYKWQEADEEYARKFEEAREQAMDVLEAEAWRRAVKGVSKPVVYRGQLQFLPKVDRKTRTIKRDEKGRIILSDQPLVVQEYSDVLLMCLMNAGRPEKYRPNYKAPDKLPKRSPLLSRLNDDDLAELRRLQRKARGEDV